MPARNGSHSLRRRLAFTTTGIFLLVGGLLLAVEYVVLSTVIEQSVDESSGGSSQSPGSERAASAVLAVAGELQRTVMIVSTLIVVVLAAVAGALIWRTASRSLGRVADVTALATDLSERNLSSRIDLQGPNDEIKDLADSLDAMLERLEVAFRAQERFVSSASHELRTPNTAIRAALEPPLVRGRFDSDVQPAVERALDASKKSELLLDALLQLARAGTPLSDTPEQVRLDDIVEALTETASIDGAQLGLAVTTQCEPATVIGDQVLLTQLTSNLIDNALKHNIPNGRINVNIDSDTSSARLTVASTSAPIESPLEQLLEPFNRGDRTRTQSGAPEGNGLGLAIVKAIAIEHGGHVGITMTKAGVFTVVVEFPAAPRGTVEAGTHHEHAPASS